MCVTLTVCEVLTSKVYKVYSTVLTCTLCQLQTRKGTFSHASKIISEYIRFSYRVYSDCCRVPDKMTVFEVSDKSILTVDRHPGSNEAMWVDTLECMAACVRHMHMLSQSTHYLQLLILIDCSEVWEKAQRVLVYYTIQFIRLAFNDCNTQSGNSSD